jgi:hypothetical protein
MRTSGGFLQEREYYSEFILYIKIYSYLKQNFLCFHYKVQSTKFVEGNNCCIFGRNQTKHTHKLSWQDAVLVLNSALHTVH